MKVKYWNDNVISRKTGVEPKVVKKVTEATIEEVYQRMGIDLRQQIRQLPDRNMLHLGGK